MRTLPTLAVLAAGLLPGLFAQPVSAAERQPFEVVKGWEVERTVGDTSANPCIMTHAYEDKDDNNAANAVVFALRDSTAVMVLVYQGWDFDKEQSVKVPLFLDKKPIKVKTTWIGDGKTLRTQLPDSVVPDLLAAKTVILRFEDSDADFRIPDFAAGYESLRRCDATPAKPAAVAAPQAAPVGPPAPSQQRIAAYVIGVSVQRVLKDCDVPSTGKQRAGVEARMAALQPEMAPLEAQVRSELKRNGESCPAADKQADFQEILRKFVELSPEDLVAALEEQPAPEKSPNTPSDSKL
ncbi:MULTISPECIES: hypothetical protein [Methylorubrum]|jgi:hypothetical protein|uniref:Uncharacterized protein n=2 Tax=Methylorubrum extorquens TaxID=408 RepID=C5AWN5_METEA|nr:MULTISPECIES: hypothetical protein [Methylorubrum]ACS40890.1 hypothetical protein MexAM1_META1p3142 [Methylorubrum extorquens AM1]EHP91205.1 hypothetical protein MetexDRAFT_3919 [Methylorubrum extorquens DSM 13060]MCP1540955.1 hypothetical protein [Methylorubrum extorquens]MCP1586508.1 hypothetical protein [Methylorubrum extorquens]BDL40307.1 hypothetical protein MSPGM_28970 [Methylorubrum sp. GM97]